MSEGKKALIDIWIDEKWHVVQYPNRPAKVYRYDEDNAYSCNIPLLAAAYALESERARAEKAEAERDELKEYIAGYKDEIKRTVKCWEKKQAGAEAERDRLRKLLKEAFFRIPEWTTGVNSIFLDLLAKELGIDRNDK